MRLELGFGRGRPLHRGVELLLEGLDLGFGGGDRVGLGPQRSLGTSPALHYRRDSGVPRFYRRPSRGLDPFGSHQRLGRGGLRPACAADVLLGRAQRVPIALRRGARLGRHPPGGLGLESETGGFGPPARRIQFEQADPLPVALLGLGCEPRLQALGSFLGDAADTGEAVGRAGQTMSQVPGLLGRRRPPLALFGGVLEALPDSIELVGREFHAAVLGR